MMHPSTAEFLVLEHQRELLDDAGRSRVPRRRLASRIWRPRARHAQD